MTRRLTLDEVIDIIDTSIRAEYGGYQWTLAARIVQRLLDEGLLNPTQVEMSDGK